MKAACGSEHSLTVSEEGEVFAFGSNFNDESRILCGKLGLGECGDQPVPRAIPELCNISCVAAGYNHSACVDMFGNLYTFGDGQYGCLGLGTLSSQYQISPGKVKLNSNIIFVACGFAHTVCVDSNTHVYTFGMNNMGQLGLGDTEHRWEPEKVKNFKDAKEVSCGGFHTFCVSHTGETYSFGGNSFGQLGLGDNRLRKYPMVLDFSAVASVSCGLYFSILMTVEGDVYACGDNSKTSLGIPEIEESNSFLHIEGLQSIVSIFCGTGHTICLDTDQRLYRFGHYTNHMDNLPSPELWEGVNDVKDIACGCNFTLILTNTQILGEGSNSYGQLGRTGAASRTTPLDDTFNSIWHSSKQRSHAKSARK